MDQVHFRGCSGLNYVGASFKLRFENKKVVAVQGIFKGCVDDLVRPEFTSKKEALQHAIEGLSACPAREDQEKLRLAKNELANLDLPQEAKLPAK